MTALPSHAKARPLLRFGGLHDNFSASSIRIRAEVSKQARASWVAMLGLAG